MTHVANIDQLTRARTKTVTVDVDGEPLAFEISKLKVGQRKRLGDECVDEDGILDLEHVARLAAEMCVVQPSLTAEVIDAIDLDVFLALADEIATHSNLRGLTQMASADAEEGAAEAKSFLAEG
jgi:hypothetical protein